MRHNINETMGIPNQVISPADILKGRQLIHEIYIDEKIEKYILDIVFATRKPKEFGLDKLTDLISYGASPRASINLALGAKAMAFIKRRGYVIPEDVRAIGQRYQVLLATPRVLTQGRGDRRVERTSRTREASMAVAGSSIVLTSMYGKWRVEPRLEGTDKPCGRPEFFTIRP